MTEPTTSIPTETAARIAAPKLKPWPAFVFISTSGNILSKSFMRWVSLMARNLSKSFWVISWEKTLPSMTAVILYFPSMTLPSASRKRSTAISPTSVALPWPPLLTHSLLGFKFSNDCPFTPASPLRAIFTFSRNSAKVG